MTQLNEIPTIGFEYSDWNADGIRKKNIAADNPTLTPDQVEESAKVHRWAKNFFNLLAIVLPVVGIGRMIYAIANEDLSQFLRGAAEFFLGAGIFLCMADLLVSCVAIDASRVATP